MRRSRTKEETNRTKVSEGGMARTPRIHPAYRSYFLGSVVSLGPRLVWSFPRPAARSLPSHPRPSALFSSLRSSEPSAVRSLRSLPKGMDRREWIGVRTGTNSPILVLTIYYLFGSSVTHSVCRSVLSSPQPPVPWSFGSLRSPHSLRVLRNEYDE